MKIHPSSDVQTDKIGENTVIWQNVVVLPGAVIGSNCNINANCFVENDVVIGNNVTVKCGVYIWDGIEIQDDVQIGPCVAFTNDLYPRAKHKFSLVRTIVEKGASLGANSTIIGGVTIGKYALIGAGAVITKDIPNNSLWIGNPARHIGYVCNCGSKLDANFFCSPCNIQFLKIGSTISAL